MQTSWELEFSGLPRLYHTGPPRMANTVLNPTVADTEVQAILHTEVQPIHHMVVLLLQLTIVMVTMDTAPALEDTELFLMVISLMVDTVVDTEVTDTVVKDTVHQHTDMEALAVDTVHQHTDTEALAVDTAPHHTDTAKDMEVVDTDTAAKAIAATRAKLISRQ